jgi:hypothetical protein
VRRFSGIGGLPSNQLYPLLNATQPRVYPKTLQKKRTRVSQIDVLDLDGIVPQAVLSNSSISV